MAWEFEIVAGPFEGTTEGPAWDGQALLFTNIPESLIMRYDPETGACTEHRTGTNRTNGLAFDTEGRLYGCSAGGRSILRFEPDGITTVVADRFEGRRLNTPNDLALDSKGRVWFTNPWNGGLVGPRDAMDLGDEQVLRADPLPGGGWAVRQVTFDITRPNGILMSPDERTLYVAQAHSDPGKLRELRAYPIRDDGSLGLYNVLHQFGEDHQGAHRGIDGMCFDTEGNIIATCGWKQAGPGPMLYVWDPSGRVLETQPMPEGIDMPTNCTFGDAGLGTLYVTDLRGHLFRVRNTGRKGWHLWPKSR